LADFGTISGHGARGLRHNRPLRYGTVITKENITMERPLAFLMLAIVGSLYLTGAASAQTSSNQPNASGVANQFESGANHIGIGFVQVGQGIKHGAILTWDAIVDGVSTTATHFNGTNEANQPAHQSH
jgi:hypothetical protein